jgi:hypothetical protein
LLANIYLHVLDRLWVKKCGLAWRANPICRRLSATSETGKGGPNVCNCLIDEGRPLGTSWQEQVPNHLRRLWSKALVVSTEGRPGKNPVR